MRRGVGFAWGFLPAFVVPTLVWALLLVPLHELGLADRVFWPLVGVPGAVGLVLLAVRRARWVGVGLVVGAAASCVVEVGALMTLFFLGGGS